MTVYHEIKLKFDTMDNYLIDKVYQINATSTTNTNNKIDFYSNDNSIDDSNDNQSKNDNSIDNFNKLYILYPSKSAIFLNINGMIGGINCINTKVPFCTNCTDYNNIDKLPRCNLNLSLKKNLEYEKSFMHNYESYLKVLYKLIN
jgi:hypothetical protein